MNDRPARIGFISFLLIAVVPIIAGLFYATLYSVGLAGLFLEGVTLRYWSAVLSSYDFWSSVVLSAYIAFAVTLATIAASLGLVLTLPDSLRRGPLASLIYLPLALPWTVAGFFTYQMLSAGGFASRLTTSIGVTAGVRDFPALVQDRAGIGIILAHVLLATPFFTLLFVALYESERIEELASLAASLGAGAGESLRRVSVPILLRGAAPNAVLLFVVVLGSSEIPLLLGRQTPQMLSVLTLRKFAMYDIAQKPQAFVVALLYAILIAALVRAAVRGGGGHDAA